ncbi:MAG TPA: Hsp20/alpha crystallin family protein [Nevskia sp.]|nr:Hsp20/alpha crystallin family protein [Nevskia sp.]
MTLAQWNPFRELDELMSRLQRPSGVPRVRPEDSWAPMVDISETAREYTVTADLPGVKKEDVKVKVENGVLTISGERKSEQEDKDARLHRIERSFGAYSRSFSLPEDVLEDKITAEHKDGTLAVHLPKTDIKKAVAKQVAVQ